METYVAVRLDVGLLAVGGGADRDPGRQEHAGHRHRDQRPVQAPAARHVRHRARCRATTAAVPDLAGDRRRPHRWQARSRAPGWEPQAEDLSFAQQPGTDKRPYDRLIGAALDGDRWLFASQDTVEAAWEIVDPVLGDAVPVHPYARGSWGPQEADRLLPAGDTWHDPAG